MGSRLAISVTDPERESLCSKAMWRSVRPYRNLRQEGYMGDQETWLTEGCFTLRVLGWVLGQGCRNRMGGMVVEGSKLRVNVEKTEGSMSGLHEKFAEDMWINCQSHPKGRHLWLGTEYKAEAQGGH